MVPLTIEKDTYMDCDHNLALLREKRTSTPSGSHQMNFPEGVVEEPGAQGKMKRARKEKTKDCWSLKRKHYSQKWPFLVSFKVLGCFSTPETTSESCHF